jgi:hypothetical protein
MEHGGKQYSVATPVSSMHALIAAKMKPGHSWVAMQLAVCVPQSSEQNVWDIMPAHQCIQVELLAHWALGQTLHVQSPPHHSWPQRPRTALLCSGPASCLCWHGQLDLSAAAVQTRIQCWQLDPVPCVTSCPMLALKMHQAVECGPLPEAGSKNENEEQNMNIGDSYTCKPQTCLRNITANRISL